MKNKINELQVSNPPQFEKNPAFFEKNFSLFTSHFSLKRRAFTLAEVLITLGIIGVVAAITLPVLSQKINNIVFTTQLKKAYSVLNQGFAKMYTDENTVSIQPELFNKYFKVIESGTNYDSDCKLGKIKNLQKNEENQYCFYFDSANYYILSDGTILSLGNRNISNNIIIIDINGPNKQPNTLGRDIFFFTLNLNNGKIEPYISSAQNDGCGGNYEIEVGPGLVGVDAHGNIIGGYEDYNCVPEGPHHYYCTKSISGKGNGTNCSAYLIQNGWQMDY